MNGIEFLGKPSRIASATHNGARNKPNEDRYDAFVGPGSNGAPAQFLVVADGVTSTHGGERASDIAVRVLRQALSALSTQPLRQRMIAAIVAANREILNAARQEPDLKGMSTTLALAAIDQGQLHVMYLGDSRVYLLRAGRAYQLTRDHTWVQEAVEEGRITTDQARTHPNRHVIQRYLGDVRPLNIGQSMVDPEQPAPDPDKTEVMSGKQRVTNTLTLRPGDAVLLCSDGLYNQVSEQEIGGAVASMTPERAVKELVNTALKRQESDNITVVLWSSAPGHAALIPPLLRRPAFAIAAASALIVLAIFFLLSQMNRSSAIPPPESTQAIVAETPDAAAVALASDTPTPMAADTETPATSGPTADPVLAAAATLTAAATPTSPTSATEAATIDSAKTPTRTQEASLAAPASSATSAADTFTPVAFNTAASETSPINQEMDAVPTSRAEAGNALLPPETLIPADEPSATPTSTSTPGANPTSTRAPTATPIVTATGTSTATPTPSQTPRPTATPGAPNTRTPTPTATAAGSAADSEGGPTSVDISSPPDGHSSATPVEFCWESNRSLEPGQRFDVVFWNAVGDSKESGRAWIESTTENCLRIDPKNQAPGSYKWGIWLIGPAPQSARIRYLGPEGGRNFSVPASDKVSPGNSSNGIDEK